MFGRKRKQPSSHYQPSPGEKHLMDAVLRVKELTQDQSFGEEYFPIILEAIAAGEAEIVINDLVHVLVAHDIKIPADIADVLLEDVELDNPQKPYTVGLREKLTQK